MLRVTVFSIFSVLAKEPRDVIHPIMAINVGNISLLVCSCSTKLLVKEEDVRGHCVHFHDLKSSSEY